MLCLSEALRRKFGTVTPSHKAAACAGIHCTFASLLPATRLDATRDLVTRTTAALADCALARADCSTT